MSATRKKRIVLVVALLILSPVLYGSAFVSTGFLYGAGVIPDPVLRFLCDTAFAPVIWLAGDSGPLEWLDVMAEDAYWMGFESRL